MVALFSLVEYNLSKSPVVPVYTMTYDAIDRDWSTDVEGNELAV